MPFKIKVIPIHFWSPKSVQKLLKITKIVLIHVPTPKIPSITKELLGITRDRHGSAAAAVELLKPYRTPVNPSITRSADRLPVAQSLILDRTLAQIFHPTVARSLAIPLANCGLLPLSTMLLHSRKGT